MRVTLYLRCRGVPTSVVELVSTGLKTDHRGVLVFTMPEGDPETEKLGTTELTAFNPEGRVPILLLPDEPWTQAEMRRIVEDTLTETLS